MSASNRRVSTLRDSLHSSKDGRRFSVHPQDGGEDESPAHRTLREHPGHQKLHACLDSERASTGVIWTTEQAQKHGFLDEPEKWSNLGQGAPEVGHIDGCFERPDSLPLNDNSREYGPTAGIKTLRAAVANLYNDNYRKGKDSQYSWENVCIVPGGRAGLIRIAAVLGNAYLGFFIPDYTAYNEMLSLFRNFVAIPTPLSAADGYHIHADKIAEELARGTSVILTSNPRNPTGHALPEDELKLIQDICRDRCTLIFDEFYSGYRYDSNCDGSSLSAAANVIDVDRDDVLLIDGLTKRFRLPGWRVAWIVGPKEFIKALSSCGSYLDGGTNVPFQEAAVSMLDPPKVLNEMQALQRHFKEKRDYVLKRLNEIGFHSGGQDRPESTFYIWLDLTSLEPPLPKDSPIDISNGLAFFDALLQEKTIVVPGIFFDLNPAKRRDLFDSPCHHFVRISYGPKMEALKMGLDGIERVVKRARGEMGQHQSDDQSESKSPSSPIQFWKGKGDGWHSKISTATGKGEGGHSGPQGEKR